MTERDPWQGGDGSSGDDADRPDQYNLEPPPEEKKPPEPLETGPEIPAGESGGEHAFCPSCGAPMPEPDASVCLRCGFDPAEEAASGVGSPRDEPTGSAHRPPPSTDDGSGDVIDDTVGNGASKTGRPIYCQPGWGDWQAPCIVAAMAGLVMIVSYLAGAGGLYEDDEVGVLARIGGVVRYVLLIGMSAALGLAALYIVAVLDAARVGDRTIAAARMLAIMAVVSVVFLIDFEHRGLEHGVQFVLLLAGVYGLVLAAFRINSNTAFVWLAVFAALQAGLALVGPALAWVYGW